MTQSDKTQEKGHYDGLPFIIIITESVVIKSLETCSSQQKESIILGH